MEPQFIKYTQSNEDTRITFYSPIHMSNIFQYSHVVGKTRMPDGKGGEEEKEYEFLGLELTLVEEQAYNVPVKKMKRVERTKEQQVFQMEEVVKLMQPVMRKITNKEEIDKVLVFLESHLI